MYEVTLLAWLFTAHCFGDFVFQTPYVAERKTTSLYICFVHAWIYTVLFIPIMIWVNYSDSAVILLACVLFVTHLILDKWNDKLFKSMTERGRFAVDQSAHLFILMWVFWARNILA